MAEVSGAYKYGTYERVWLKSLLIMGDVQAFAMQDAKIANVKSGISTLDQLVLALSPQRWVKQWARLIIPNSVTGPCFLLTDHSTATI